FAGITQDLFDKVERNWTSGVVIDFSIWIRCFTTDILSSTLTGSPAVCPLSCSTSKFEYTPEMKKSSEFLESLKTWFNSLPFFVAIPRSLRYNLPILSSINRHYLNNAKRLEDEVLETVIRRREQLGNFSEGQASGDGLLDTLLTMNIRDHNEPAEDDEPMKDGEIRDNIMDISLTSSDTTGNSFCYFIYYIFHNPQCKERLLEEIDSIFADDMTRPVTYNDLKKLVYMEAAIKETLRVFPVVPIAPRSLANPDTLLGYNWPAGQLFFISQYSLMHNKNVWEEPHKFNPDRFLKDTEKIQKKFFVPFGELEFALSIIS
ncbi:8619_t:CDS:2, partial [Acaulospora morrowiae]